MSATATALLERDEELATIERLLDEAEAGSGGVIVIEGEAGAGKTSLLGAAAEIASRREMLVLRARGGEYERDFPYGVVRQLFEPVLRDRARRAELLSDSAALAGPVFEPGDAEAAEGGAIEHGLYWLAVDLAATAPLLLIVDDAQWADLASLQALSYIGRRLDGSSAAMAVGVRSGEPGFHERLLDELRREAPERVIEPSPLSTHAAAVLVAGETGIESTESFAKACRDATAGNPFLLAELARSVRTAELDQSDEGVECLTQAAAVGVSHSIQTRLAGLGEHCVKVARMVAVLEPNAAPRRVAQLSGLSPAEVTEAGERLIAARLLGDASLLSFTHPLVRHAVLSEIPAPRLASLHARAARMLDEDGEEVDTVAAHLLLAEPVADEWAVTRLRAAAAAAFGRGAVDAAVRYLRRALREPPSGDTRPGVSRELGVALLRANDPEGLEVLRTVRAATSEVELRAAIANELASSLGLRNGNEEAAGLLEESLSELPDPDGELGLMLRGWLLIQVIWGLERVPEAIPAQLPSPDTLSGRAVLQSTASLYALGLAPMEQALRSAEAAASRPETLFTDAVDGLPPQGALVALALADRGGTVAELFDFAIEGSRRRGVLPGLAGGHGVRALAHLLDGDLREAQADAEIAIDVLRGFELIAPRAFWSGVAMRVQLRRGELAAAERQYEELWGGRERVAGCPGAVLLSTRGELRAAAGRYAEARNDFLAAAERIRWLPLANPETFPWRIGLARCEAALGNGEEAQRVAAEALGIAREAGGVRGIGISLREQGLLAGGAEGIELLADAAETLGGTRARLQHAEALFEWGAALRRANFRKEAREPLREAMELAHRCGARPLEERARVELAATGARPRKAVFTGVESLTPSELRVARMAADGMTNREIAQALTVTAKTVETHMRHVFQKLDVTKRGELAATLA